MDHIYSYFSEIFITAYINKYQHKLQWKNLNMSALLLNKQYKYLGEKQCINILEGKKNEPKEQGISIKLFTKHTFLCLIISILSSWNGGQNRKGQEGQQWGWEITFVRQCQAEDRPKGYFPP